METTTENTNNPCRIVVVDDDTALRMVIVTLLQSYGAEVVGEADNGADAVQKVSELSPDLTFMDINMPTKSGVEALKEITEMDPTAAVVMLTSESDMALADSCIELGAKNYIRKGSTTNVLEIMLKDAIANYGRG